MRKLSCEANERTLITKERKMPDNGLDMFENEAIEAEMRKRGKEKLSEKEMQEVMDTVNPGFWEQWKSTEKRIAVDDKHVNVITAAVSFLLYAPPKMVKQQCVMIAKPDYPLGIEFSSLSRPPSFFRIPKIPKVKSFESH
jgi:arsenate reductase-like glutaredoxin family protein